MQTYSAPVRDMQFVLNEVLRVEDRFAELPGFEEVSADLVDGVLEQAGRLFEEVVHPTNMPGHEEGCERRSDGTVRLPEGFRKAYGAVRDAGWLSLSADPEYGGQGLPETLSFFIDEMFASANMALSLLPGLTHGASIRDRIACLGGAAGEVPPEHGERAVERHDVPHRVACRHRSRDDPHPRGAAPGRELRDYRHQDLHHLRRARPHREHRPSRAREAAGCAVRGERDQPSSWSRNFWSGRTASPASGTARLASRSKRRWASRRRRPAS